MANKKSKLKLSTTFPLFPEICPTTPAIEGVVAATVPCTPRELQQLRIIIKSSSVLLFSNK